MYELLEQYLFFFSRKNAASTANRVKYQLLGFIQYLLSKNITGFYQLDSDLLLTWNRYLKKKYQKRTVASQHSVVKGLLNWLYSESYFLINPWPEFLQAKQGESLPRAYPSKKSAVKFLHHIHEN